MDTGKASVESATAGAGVVWGVEVNIVDFWCECENRFLFVRFVGVLRL